MNFLNNFDSNNKKVQDKVNNLFLKQNLIMNQYMEAKLCIYIVSFYSNKISKK